MRPMSGAGMPGEPRLRAARNDSRGPVLPYRVCRWQTADVPHQSSAHYTAGEIGGTHRQARVSESQRLASDGLSFPLRPQRSGARAYGEKTADLVAHVRAWSGVSIGARRDRLRHGRGEGGWPATTSP